MKIYKCNDSFSVLGKVAFIYSEFKASYLDDPVIGLPEVFRMVRSQGYGVDCVAFEERQSVDFKQYGLVIFSPALEYIRYPEDVFKFMALLDSQGIHMGNSLQSMLWNSKKYYVHEFSKTGDVPIPYTEILEPFNDPKTFMENFFQTRGVTKAVTKPVLGAYGQDTISIRVEDLEPDSTSTKLSELCSAQQKHGEMLVQEFAPEIISGGEYSYYFFDGELSHCIHKFNPSGDFRVQHIHGGITELVEPRQKMLKFCYDAMKHIKGAYVDGRPPMYIRMDFFGKSGPNAGRTGCQLMEIEMFDTSMLTGVCSNAAEMYANAIVNHIR